MRYLILFAAALLTLGCVDPVSLNKPVPRVPGRPDMLALPINVTRAFSPTGYFWNSWAAANPPNNTIIDPAKWRSIMTFESIKAFEDGCDDRVSPAALARDTSMSQAQKAAFYDEYRCTKFVYAPHYENDLFGGVFWLSDNNFGSSPGVWVDSGISRIVFWARSLEDTINVEFGAGITNDDRLKPFPLYTPHVDWFGHVDSSLKSLNITTQGDTLEYLPDALTGRSLRKHVVLGPDWTRVEIGAVSHTGGQPLPSFRLLGAFFWAMTANNLKAAPHDTTVMMVRDTLQVMEINPDTSFVDSATGRTVPIRGLVPPRVAKRDSITGEPIWIIKPDTTFPPATDPATGDTLYKFVQDTLISPRATVLIDGVRYE